MILSKELIIVQSSADAFYCFEYNTKYLLTGQAVYIETGLSILKTGLHEMSV